MEGEEWWIWIQAGGKKAEKMVQGYQSQHFMKGRNSLPPLHIEEQLKRCSVLITLLNIALRTLSGTTTFSLWLTRCTGTLYFLRKWRNTGLGNSVLKLFYRCVVHHCVAWNLLYGKEDDSASGCENYTKDCKQQPPHHQINQYQHMSEMFPV